MLFSLGAIFELVDMVSGPMKGVRGSIGETQKKLKDLGGDFKNVAKAGAKIAGVGVGIAVGLGTLTAASFDSKAAIGELASVGIKDFKALENAGQDFSNNFSGTSTANYLRAAYDIKSGIASLSDEGVAEFTTLSALTAKATKATTDEMTKLFALGYGILKTGYKDMSDIEFGRMFSGGISKAVQSFRTDGADLIQGISNLGAQAQMFGLSFEEQLSVIGTAKSAFNSASEAATGYRAFLSGTVAAQEKLGLSFLDSQGKMLPMVDILGKIKGKYGDLNAIEIKSIKDAFGSDEAVKLIGALLPQTDALANNIKEIRAAAKGGTATTLEMANAMNLDPGARVEVLGNRLWNLAEILSTALLPVVFPLVAVVSDFVLTLQGWAKEHKELVQFVLTGAAVVAGFLIVVGGGVATVGLLGWGVTALTSNFVLGTTVIKVYGLAMKSGLISAMSFKNGLMLLRMAVFGPLAALKAFSVALLGTPIGWIVLAVGALIFILWKFKAQVMAFGSGFLKGVFDGARPVINALKEAIGPLVDSVISLLTPAGAVTSELDGWVAVGHLIGSVFGAVFGLMITPLTAAVTVISAVVGFVDDLFNGMSLEEAGGRMIETLVVGLKKAFNLPLQVVEDGIALIKNLFGFGDSEVTVPVVAPEPVLPELKSPVVPISYKTDMPELPKAATMRVPAVRENVSGPGNTDYIKDTPQGSATRAATAKGGLLQLIATKQKEVEIHKKVVREKAPGSTNNSITIKELVLPHVESADDFMAELNAIAARA